VVAVAEDEVALAVTEEVAEAEVDLETEEAADVEVLEVIEAVEDEVLVEEEEVEAGVEVAEEAWEEERKCLLSRIVMLESSSPEERKML